MMMPANYSVIAENEMTYVIGGGIADILAPALTTENWKKFNTNLVTLIGNHYMDKYVLNTLGVIFSGTYSPRNGIVSRYFTNVSRIWNNNVGVDPLFGGPIGAIGSYAVGALNVALNAAGNAAAIYNLATANVKNSAEGSKF